jgi:heme exporter protein D
MDEFLHMGGHAFFVWSAYAAALILILLDFLPPVFKLKRLREALARRRRAAGR